MDLAKAERVLLGIHGRIQELNLLYRAFGVGEVFFRDSTLGTPSRLNPPELGLIRTISWSYMLLFETGKVSVRYLVSYRSQAKHENAERLSDNLRLVSVLRTYFQHHLEFSSDHDVEISEESSAWLQKVCGTAVPTSDEHWDTCLVCALLLLDELLIELVGAVRDIEQHPAREELIAAWRARISRSRTPAEFDAVVAVVAADIGQSGLDVVKFRNRHHEHWQKALANVAQDVDSRIEVRKLIEASMLAERWEVLPLSGEDVMNQLDVSPGPRVGHLLQVAKKLYEEAPCGREVLLERLAKYMREEPIEAP